MRESNVYRRRRGWLLLRLLRKVMGFEPADSRSDAGETSPAAAQRSTVPESSAPLFINPDGSVEQHVWTEFDDPFHPREQLSRDFLEQCGGFTGFGLNVTPQGSTVNIRIPIETASFLIGSGAGCQLQLSHPEIAAQHFLLVWIEGRLLWCDLASTRNPPDFGWWEKGDSLVAGPFRLKLESRRWAEMPKSVIDSPFTAKPPVSMDDLPLQLEPDNDTTPPEIIPLSPRLLLFGGAPQNPISLPRLGLSAVQSAIVRTGTATWIVALSPAATIVNGRSVPFARLSPGDSLELGSCRWEVKPFLESASRFAEDETLATEVETFVSQQRQHLSAVEDELRSIERSVSGKSVTDLQELDEHMLKLEQILEKLRTNRPESN